MLWIAAWRQIESEMVESIKCVWLPHPRPLSLNKLKERGASVDCGGSSQSLLVLANDY